MGTALQSPAEELTGCWLCSCSWSRGLAALWDRALGGGTILPKILTEKGQALLEHVSPEQWYLTCEILAG